MNAPSFDKDLYRHAYDICVEVRDGKWDRVLAKVRNGQPAASEDVIEELKRRCAGFSKEQYQAVIARAMHDSM